MGMITQVCHLFVPTKNTRPLDPYESAKELLDLMLWARVVNGPHFEARTRPKPKITSPNLARARRLFLKPI